MKSNGKTVLIVGSNGAIGSSLKVKYEEDGWRVISIGNSPNPGLTIDLTEELNIDKIQAYLTNSGCPDLVIHCAGLLHDSTNMPERTLEDVNAAWIIKSMEVNLLSHVNIAKAINRVITKDKPLTWVSLSAMVGSITDNGLGGWYSYRTSKAALNMFIKTLSIEWKRKNKENRTLLIHPGTTKSDMSAPFNVRKDKLCSPRISAQRIYDVIANTSTEANGEFYNWNSEKIPW